MRHYRHLTEEQMNNIFYKLPEEFTKDSTKSILSKALGATMYMPATRETISQEIINQKHLTLTTMVIDLEDALDDDNVLQGEENLVENLEKVEKEIEEGNLKESDIPLIFLRVRNPEQLYYLLDTYGLKLSLLTGFNLPKFSSKNAKEYLQTITIMNKKYNTSFYAMPILESKEVIYKENRIIELVRLKEIVDQYNDIVLNIRIGGTDFSGLYSIRRSIDTTIYDVLVVRDAISDILNVFNRAEDEYVVSGVVWEFFSNHKRLLKPTLRESPFLTSKGMDGLSQRKDIIHDAVDGLIREIIIEKSNGIIGKTIIHPSHIPFVNALQTVTQEEYEDAMVILENRNKGVLKSNSGNKMNEMKPHYNWALNIVEKAKVYGVLKHDKNYNELF